MVEKTAESGCGSTKSEGVDHLTGVTVTRLMRKHGKTIRDLSSKMGITQKRVRYVRANGVDGCEFAADWLEAITGSGNAGWDAVARAYLSRAAPNLQARTCALHGT